MENLVVITETKLTELIKDAVNQEFKKHYSNGSSNEIKGTEELAKVLGVSVNTIFSWKKKGLLSGTYRQIGRTIFYNLEKIKQNERLNIVFPE